MRRVKALAWLVENKFPATQCESRAATIEGPFRLKNRHSLKIREKADQTGFGEKFLGAIRKPRAILEKLACEH
jgi:hypothetical protein